MEAGGVASESTDEVDVIELTLGKDVGRRRLLLALNMLDANGSGDVAVKSVPVGLVKDGMAFSLACVWRVVQLYDE